MDPTTQNLRDALEVGDPQMVSALIDAGADIHYQADEGYDAVIDAVHGRDVLRNPNLIELLTLLIDQNVSLRGMSTYGESGVRVLSRLGRFDAVQLLIKAGANPKELEFTPLMEAVAFGSLADVEAVVARGVDLEEREYWERTAWLIAIQTGDIPKAQFLLNHGARSDAQGRCGTPPLFYAIETEHMPMLEWLLDIGLDVEQTDEFDETALTTAAGYDNAEAVAILLRAGADVNLKKRYYGPLGNANSREVALLLLDAGADPLDLASRGRRAILGYPPATNQDRLDVSVEEFQAYRSFRFGTQNPEVMTNSFWEGMIRSGLTAYTAAVQIEGERDYERDYEARRGPVWCAERFGQSMTFLPDGRIVQVAGEHEDSYDIDFCIYNDVFVHDPDGTITIYGYPESVFPPTDFHSATLIGDFIYLVGSIGYMGTRRFGETPVYRLNVNTFQIEPVETTGNNHGWIYGHRAVLTSPHQIQISGGKIVTRVNGRSSHDANFDTFTLNIETGVWSKL